MKLFIYLFTAVLSIASVHAEGFDLPSMNVNDMKAQWRTFDAAQVTAAPGTYGKPAASGDFDFPSYKVIQGVAFPQEGARGGSLHGSTFRWERDQRAAWGSGIPGLTQYEAQRACGPIAAEALVRFLSNDPKLNKIGEIFSLAKRKGYWNGAMQGPGSEQRLLADLGVQVSEPIWSGNMEQMIRASLDQGKPVIVSTNAHYFFVEGYDNNGRLFVGYTGEVMRCGSAQMTLNSISQCGRGGLALLLLK